MVEQYPFFVYGSLREGEENFGWALAETAEEIIPATFHGGKIFGARAFPFASLTTDNTNIIRGEIIYVADEYYNYTLRELDRLEGYRPNNPDSFYNRTIVEAIDDDNIPHLCWIYHVDEHSHYITGLPVIPHGDWIKWKNDLQLNQKH